jgi:phospholipid transport system substrate-binding protein
MRGMKTFLQAMTLLVFVGVAWAGPPAPDAVVKDTTEEILESLRNDPDFPKIDRGRIAAEVERIVLPHIDLQRMTRFALGESWEQATDEQRETIQVELQQLFAHTVTAALSQYDGQPVSYLPLHMQADASEAEVTARVQVAPNDYDTVDFSMERMDDEWKVYDIAYEGVSIAKNYRSQFSSLISKSGVAGLIQTLQQKNNPGKSDATAMKTKS